MRYKFTKLDCSRGGKSRAAQAADQRRGQPTPWEATVREYLSNRCPPIQRIEYEYPVETATNLVQYIDIAIWISDQPIFIEVDGSHDWHNVSYITKMMRYDDMKLQYCNCNNILLVTVHPDRDADWMDRLDRIIGGVK